jgi:hypothetical protein
MILAGDVFKFDAMQSIFQEYHLKAVMELSQSFDFNLPANFLSNVTNSIW